MIHLFTHNDLDGVGCGILAKIAYKDNVMIHYCSISSLELQIKEYLKNSYQMEQDQIFVTDLSTNEDMTIELNELVNKGGKIRLIDHHKSALHLNQYTWATVSVECKNGTLSSATSLFYEYLKQNKFTNEAPAIIDFVELVRQYDTWEWEKNNNDRAKRLNDLFFLLSIEEFENKMVGRLVQQERFDFDEFERKLLSMEEAKIERYIRKKKRELVQTYIDGHCVGIVHAESYFSELGNELGKEYPHIDYIALLSLGTKKISYRTIHDHVDVSEIAQQFGGGGHAKASGSSMSKQAFTLYVESVFNLDPIRQDATKNKYNIKGSERGGLYENRNGEKFFIFLNSDGKWVVEMEDKKSNQIYDTYEVAVNELKRSHLAALVKDESFVEYLLQYKMT
jgi:uncharacterized protein